MILGSLKVAFLSSSSRGTLRFDLPGYKLVFAGISALRPAGCRGIQRLFTGRVAGEIRVFWPPCQGASQLHTAAIFDGKWP